MISDDFSTKGGLTNTIDATLPWLAIFDAAFLHFGYPVAYYLAERK